MANFSLSEILTIMLIILIVFGPDRLPEMAKKAGELVRKGRAMVTDLRHEFEGEWNEVSQPLKEVRQEILGVKSEVESSMASLNDDIAKAKKELEAQVAEAKHEIEEQVAETEDELRKTLPDGSQKDGKQGAVVEAPDQTVDSTDDPSGARSVGDDEVPEQ